MNLDGVMQAPILLRLGIAASHIDNVRYDFKMPNAYTGSHATQVVEFLPVRYGAAL